MIKGFITLPVLYTDKHEVARKKVDYDNTVKGAVPTDNIAAVVEITYLPDYPISMVVFKQAAVGSEPLFTTLSVQEILERIVEFQ